MVETASLIGLIVAMGELAKKSGIPKRFIPLLDVVLGLSFTIGMAKAIDFNILKQGLMIGLSAAGFYDLKKPFKK